MDIRERVSLFQGLLNCNYKLSLRTYDEKLNLIDTNCPEGLSAEDTVTMLNFTSVIKEHAKTKNA